MPSDWSRFKVRDLISRHFSGPSPTCEERPIQTSREWGLLKTTAITWDAGWNWRKHKVPPRSYWDQERIEVRSGDVLVTKAGPRHRVGVVAHVDHTPPHIMVSGKMVGLRPDPDRVVPRVLADVLAVRDSQKYLDQRTTGMAESQVNFANSTLLSTPVSIPSLPEQRRIAEILDTLDKAIRTTEQVIAKLQQMKQGLLHDLLTRGIDENGELRDPERHPEQFKESPLGGIPRTWKLSSLGAQLTLQRGFDITVAQQRPGPFPVVSSSGITSYHNKAMVEGPGVVTGRKGKLGDAYFVETPFWPHDTSLWVKHFHGNDPRFGALYLGWMRLERFDAATSVPTLNRNFVHPLAVAFPPPAEQTDLVTALATFDRRLDQESEEREKLRTLKHGLMDDLLTGRVRVIVANEATA